MDTNAYTLRLIFGTNLNRTGTINISRAKADLIDTQASELMALVLASGIVRLTAGDIVSKESAALVTTTSKEFVF